MDFSWTDEQLTLRNDTGESARNELADDVVARDILTALSVLERLDCRTEEGTEGDLRDGTGGLLYSGTSDVQRTIVARLLGL